jgi:hypothetical protein
MVVRADCEKMFISTPSDTAKIAKATSTSRREKPA